MHDHVRKVCFLCRIWLLYTLGLHALLGILFESTPRFLSALYVFTIKYLALLHFDHAEAIDICSACLEQSYLAHNADSHDHQSQSSISHRCSIFIRHSCRPRSHNNVLFG